jgi:hypothetical protein
MKEENKTGSKIITDLSEQVDSRPAREASDVKT